jgi:hypothetical protein
MNEQETTKQQSTNNTDKIHIHSATRIALIGADSAFYTPALTASYPFKIVFTI